MARNQGHIRDRGMGQFRGQNRSRLESPDRRNERGKSVKLPVRPTGQHRADRRIADSCPRCGMTKDMWKENSGQGLHKGGVTYCCKACAQAKKCTCAEMSMRNGNSLGGFQGGQGLSPNAMKRYHHNRRA